MKVLLEESQIVVLIVLLKICLKVSNKFVLIVLLKITENRMNYCFTESLTESCINCHAESLLKITLKVIQKVT